MKRVLIFPLLGPPLGMLVFIAERVAAEMLAIGEADWRIGLYFGVLLLFAYLIGIIPALLTCIVDWQLDLRRVPYRIGLTALFASVASYPFLENILSHKYSAGWSATMALTSMIPAAVCSWLSGDAKSRGTQ